MQTGFFNSETPETAPPGALGSVHEIAQPLKPSFSSPTISNHLEKPKTNPENSEAKKTQNRLNLWKLQDVAASILPAERISGCLRRRIAPEVSLYQTKENYAFYGGLMRCGSVWLCPKCSAKISERRKNEIEKAVDLWKDEGGEILFLTLTIRHKKTDSLPFLLSGLSRARRLFKNRKTYKTWAKEIGLFGSIVGSELTYGKNGWHPHCHELLFVKAGQKPAGIRKLRKMWASACIDSGLPATGVAGVDLRNGEKKSSYISKWGLADELTKSNKKNGKDLSKTPWDFLRDIQKDKNSSSVGLFQDYAKAVKGKRQLLWSKGLKKYFTLEEKTDEQLAEEKEKEARIIGAINPKIWKQICKDKRRGEVLELARSGWYQVQQFISASYGFILTEEQTEKEEVKPAYSFDCNLKKVSKEKIKNRKLKPLAEAFLRQCRNQKKEVINVGSS